MIDLDRLKSNLMTSGLQQKDNPLFQVISQLIDAVRQFSISTGSSISSTGSSIAGLLASIAGLLSRTFLTFTDESATLPNSIQFLAGTGIVFDSLIPGELTISVDFPASIDHVVMSDGALPIPSPVDDGFGNFIYIQYTP